MGGSRAFHVFGACVFLFVIAVAAVFSVLPTALADNASGDDAPFVVSVHLSSDPEKSEDALEVRAIEEFVSRYAEQVNASGGIRGRPLEIAFFDDNLKAEKTKTNVDAALRLSNLIGMIGVWSSTRGAGIVDRVGATDIPFVSEMSVATLFSDYSNVYSLTRSVRSEFKVFASYAIALGTGRVSFVGAADDLYTRTYFEHLDGQHGSAGPQVSLASTYWLDGEIENNIASIDVAIEAIKRENPDIVFLSIRSVPGAKFLKRLGDAGVRVPVFIALGSVRAVMAHPGGRDYGGPLVEIAEGGIANLNNERLEKIARGLGEYSGGISYKPNQIGYGARYADMLALMVEAAREPGSMNVQDVRARINQKLSGLREHKRYWSGSAQHWSFRPDRASAERALIVWRPAGEDRSILAPMQYIELDDRPVEVPVLYVHLDMVRVFAIDSGDKSFEAEFFFTTRSESEVPISAITFTNAYRAKTSKQPIINIQKVDERRGPGAGAGGTKVYRVSGRFRFEPDLARYPFDEQILSISFQPSSTVSAFFLQPSAQRLRRSRFDVDGWKMRDHYVGTDDLIIRSVSGPVMDEHVIPYYTFNYTWVMKRYVIDYLLRVIVPLSCILIVSYLAVFIPREEFNATIAIQVTALLSAIALYFALNQPQADDATLSDLIFVASYAIIALMISLSIFEVNTALVKRQRVLTFVRMTQIYLVPFIAIAILLSMVGVSGQVLGH